MLFQTLSLGGQFLAVLKHFLARQVFLPFLLNLLCQKRSFAGNFLLFSNTDTFFASFRRRRVVLTLRSKTDQSQTMKLTLNHTIMSQPDVQLVSVSSGQSKTDVLL